MKKHLLFLLLFSLTVHSQNNYFKGYYINNSGEKIDCLVYSFDFEYSPNKLKIKSDENSEFKIVDIKDIQEFSLSERYFFKRFNVKIDESSNDFSKMSTESKLNFTEKTLFLEQIVSGKANLYVYKSVDVTKYFYSIDGSEIEQLEYKKYIKHPEIFENKRYKQKLLNDFKNGGIQLEDVEKTDYDENSLIKLFNKYNSFFGGLNEIDNRLKARTAPVKFGFTVRTGLNFSSISYSHSEEFYGDVDFDLKQSFRLGIEVEILFFKKFAIIVEPTYRYYKDDAEQINGVLSSSRKNVSIEYNSIEIPVGLRRYFNVSKNFDVYADAVLYLDNFLSEKEQESLSPGGLTLSSSINFGFGIGMKYKAKYFIEFKYDTPRELSSSFTQRSTKFNNYGLIFGYRFF